MQTISKVLAPSVARTTSAAGSDIVIQPNPKGAIVLLDCTARSGTSPTLNVYLQHAVRNAASGDTDGSIPTGVVTYTDYVAFAQLTNTGKRVAQIDFATANVEFALTDAALTAGQLRTGPISDHIRVKWVIAATTPSFTFSVVIQLFY